MSSETSCPSCGTPIPAHRPVPTVSHSLTHCAEATGPDPCEPAETAAVSAPAPAPVAIHSDSNTNHDMPTLRDIGPASEPDPLLGEFDPKAACLPQDSISHDADPDEFEVPPSLTASDDTTLSSVGLLGIDVTLPAASRPSEVTPASVDEMAVPPARGNLPMVLLGSYASAMTLAVGWLLYDRRSEAPSEPDPPPASTQVVGSRAGQGRRVTLEDIPEERTTTIGRAIRVGSVEIEPLGVRLASIRLLPKAQPLLGSTRSTNRAGGEAWALRLRIKNLSKQESFYPLDEAYLRQGERGPIDSFIETGPEGRVYLYPLAVESEWAIEGQEFRELRPLEAHEALIVSEPDPTAGERPLVWRIRLRVSADRTETVAIQTPLP